MDIQKLGCWSDVEKGCVSPNDRKKQPHKNAPFAVDVCGAGCWLLKNVKFDQSAGDFALEIVTGSFDLRSQGWKSFWLDPSSKNAGGYS